MAEVFLSSEMTLLEICFALLEVGGWINPIKHGVRILKFTRGRYFESLENLFMNPAISVDVRCPSKI